MPIFAPEFIAWFKGGAGTAAGGLRAAARWSAQAALTAALTVGLLLAVQHGCPAPGPVPPTPPGPVPPADPFVKALQAAYDAEADPQKGQNLAGLTALYRNAGPTCRRDDLKTAADLLAAMHDAAGRLVGDGLPKVRRAAADELDRTLPTSPAAPLDGPTRDRAAAAFARVAAALSEVK